jgi:hypothetical protein
VKPPLMNIIKNNLIISCNLLRLTFETQSEKQY